MNSAKPINDMDGCYGQHGWREFHTNRKDILAKYDRLAEKTKNQRIIAQKASL